MADKKKTESKAASGPPENKAAEPKLATTEQGEEQAKASEEGPSLKKAQEKRQQELAQAGYRIPAEWYTDEEATEKREKAIAKNQPPTQAQEHKP